MIGNRRISSRVASAIDSAPNTDPITATPDTPLPRNSANSIRTDFPPSAYTGIVDASHAARSVSTPVAGPYGAFGNRIEDRPEYDEVRAGLLRSLTSSIE